MGALPKYEPFPAGDRPAAGPAAGSLPAGPVLLTRLESESPPDFDLAPYPARGAHILPLRPVAGAIAIVLAICLALILDRGSPQPANPKPAAPVAQTAAQAAFQTAIQTANQTNAVHPVKPSAYGEAFVPPRVARRNHPTAPVPASDAPAPASAAPATPSR